MATEQKNEGGDHEMQPWQTKLKDQYGIGVTLDTSRGNKRFKVRYRWHSKILNLGRFTDAHEARLAYDQAVARLAPGRKKTNYWPGTYQLTSPSVEAKLQQFLQENHAAAVEAMDATTQAVGMAQAAGLSAAPPAAGPAAAAPAAAAAAAAGAHRPSSSHAATAAHAERLSWPGLVHAGSGTRHELGGSRDAVSASPPLQLQPSGLETAASNAGLPDLEEVDQGLYDWLLMMGPQEMQAAALHPSEVRVPQRQQYHEYQHGSVPVQVPQIASSDGSGPLPAAAAAANCLPPSGLLHGSASIPGTAPGACAMRFKATLPSRSRSYGTSLQSAGVSKPAGHRGYQALMNMANEAVAGSCANAGMACTAAGGAPGGVPTAAGGSSCSLAPIAAALLHNHSLDMRAGFVQLVHLGSPAPTAATAAAVHGQGLSATAIPMSSMGSPASAQPTVAQLQSGLLGWPSSSSVSSYQQLMPNHHPVEDGEGLGHGPVCLQATKLPAPSPAMGGHHMPADGQQQQQQQQQQQRSLPTLAASPQASPADVCSSKAAATAADAFLPPWANNGMTAGAEGMQSESVPSPRQTMWQQLSTLLHMQEQHQLHEEQQRQEAAAARASCQIQLQQQQLLIQELQQQMADLQSVLLLCKNSRRCSTHAMPA